MKSSSIIFRMLITATVAGIAGLLSGCGLSAADSNEFARITSQEISNMGANSSTMIGASSLSKPMASVAADTVYYDWQVHPYTWTPAIGGYIRTATVTCSDGYDRVRVDTLIFKDANGNTLQHPTLATVSAISHVRNVKRTKGGNELDIRVVMNSVVSLSPDTTHVKNGTITGTYDGEQVATGSITDVKRDYANGRWQFPSSGTISVDFPHRSYEVDFLGSDAAKLTVTNKTTDKTTIVTCHIDQT